MRYQIIATSLTNRHRLLAMGDDEKYYLLSLTGIAVNSEPISGTDAQRMQYDRSWVPTADRTRRTPQDLRLRMSTR